MPHHLRWGYLGVSRDCLVRDADIGRLVALNPNVILDLCSGSGSWSEPYKKHGYDVRQIDILDGIYIRLMEKLDCTIHGILAAPPCTALAV